MRLSTLQKYILKQCFWAKDKIVAKSVLPRFYDYQQKKPKANDIINIITKSVERLIKKELIVGFGEKTAQKWFINKVKLTSQGRKVAKSLLGIQQKLPLRNIKNKKQKIKNTD
jgi:hypothetical protein